MKLPRHFVIALFALALLDAYAWYLVLGNLGAKHLELDFLNVGQGDSQLINLPEGPRILIDGGPGNALSAELAKAIPGGRYVDIMVITHPEADHMTGFIDVIEHYDIGLVVMTGRTKETVEWLELEDLIRRRQLPVFLAAEGDRIRVGESELDFISPGPRFINSSALNDTPLVSFLRSGGISALFTADIGENVESYLIDRYNLDADILKVGHHGSRYSSSDAFLREVTPAIAIIQSGKNNYGHPHPEALKRLEAVGAKIYRNDTDGTIKIRIDGGRALVSTAGKN